MITEPYCPHCGTRIDRQEAKPDHPGGAVQCPTCMQYVKLPLPQPEAGQPQADPFSVYSPAWEGRGGALSGLWKTIWQMMIYPRRTMAAPGSGKLMWPLCFAIIMGVFGMAGSKLVNVLLGWEKAGGLNELLEFLSLQVGMVAAVFIEAAILHFMLWIVRGARRGYRATFRAVGYSNAPAVCMLLPGVGPFLTLIWSFCILVGGLAGAHGISRLRSAVAASLPLLLLVAFMVGMVLIFGLGLLQEIMRNQGLGRLWTI